MDGREAAQDAFLRGLCADLAALQHEGIADERRAAIYEQLLALGALDEAERVELAERAVARADEEGEFALRVLARVVALSHLPDAQRAVARELTEMIERGGSA